MSSLIAARNDPKVHGEQTQTFLMSIAISRRMRRGEERGAGAGADAVFPPSDVGGNHQFLSVALVFINLSDGDDDDQMKRHRWTPSQTIAATATTTASRRSRS